VTIPQYVPGHGLLNGKTVVVTAAAGTGIGFATAKRAVEEGATVLISDAHERRLGEAAEELGVPSIPCDVTDEAAVQRLIDGAVAELGGIDVLVNNAGLGGEAPIVDMTDEHLPHDACRAEGDVRRGRRCPRQQRVGPGLARPARAGPLRRGQGRRHGVDPVRRRRGG
jgi:hypothetical protein